MWYMYHFRVSSVRLDFLSGRPVGRNFVRGVVYVPLCIQMIDQPWLKLLNSKVVHVPLWKQSPTG